MSQRSIDMNGSTLRAHYPLDAVQMLKTDHRRMELLFDRFINSNPIDYPALAMDILRELKIHSLLEEELFYPALYMHRHLTPLAGINQTVNGTDGLTREAKDKHNDADLPPGPVVSAYGDHRLMRAQIGQLLRKNVSDVDFRHGMVELKDIVLDHICAEEDTLFPHAQLTIDLQALGREMQERKAAMLSETA